MKTWLKLLLGLGPPLGLAVALGLVHLHRSAQIRRHFEMLKAEGVPFTLDEVTKDYRAVSAAENGARHYEKAFAALKGIELLGQRNVIGRGPDFDAAKVLAQDRGLLERVLKQNSVFYTYLGEATKWKRAAYDLRFEEGFHMLMKHLSDMRGAFRCIQLHSLFAAERRDVGALIRNIELTLALADSIREEPVLISALTRAAGIARAAGLTELMLGLGKPSEDELSELEELWKGREVRTQFRAAMRYDRWVISEVFRASSSEFTRLTQAGASATEPVDSSGTTMGMAMLSLIGAKKGDHLYFLERYRELEKAWERERLPLVEVDRLRVDVESVRRQTGSAAKEGMSFRAPQMKIISGMMLPGELKGAETIIGAEMQIDLVRAGLAVARQQVRSGELPEDIGQVEGMNSGWLRDVFSGESIRISWEEKGLTLTSVGRNRKEDGVREVSGEMGAPGAPRDDIAFFVRRW